MTAKYIATDAAPSRIGYDTVVRADELKRLASECGFALAGIATAGPIPEAGYYLDWVRRGLAADMTYLTDRRAGLRSDPRNLLPSARSILCVGMLYNGPRPYSTEMSDLELGWISRYAWGEDYHSLMSERLTRLVEQLQAAVAVSFEWKICVDTAPLLERALARRAGLGWIGRNSCLISEQQGSWFFLGEVLLSLDFDPDTPPPDRCGVCTACIDACPTQAIVPAKHPGGPEYELDSRLCISYFTIESRTATPEPLRASLGNHVFGCDICQDVCPWNRRAAASVEPALEARNWAPALDKLASLSEDEFRRVFGTTPVSRARYRGFLRNVATAMGNSGLTKFRAPLERLSESPDAMIAEHARWALARITATGS
jgi:epoxyqueuosine reductase